jgi:sialidase-1
VVNTGDHRAGLVQSTAVAIRSTLLRDPDLMKAPSISRFPLVVLLLCEFLAPFTHLPAMPLREETTVWRDREDEMAVHFVYGLVTTRSGAVLAFSEARIGSGDDETPHHLALKRSEDSGATWSDTLMVERSDGNYWRTQDQPDRRECWANPAALTDRGTGRVFVFYVLNEGVHNGKKMQRYTRNFYRYSDDEGKTWSSRVDITDRLNATADGRPNRDASGEWIRDVNGFPCDHLGRAFHMPGPGHGLQLKDGRLLMQFWNRTAIGSDAGPISREQRAYGLRMLYSDDGGAHWKTGSAFGEEIGPTESRLVELDDGSLYLNARVDGPGNTMRRRAIFIGTDRGQIWTFKGFDTEMPAYTNVDSGLIALRHDGRQVLLLSHARDLRRRMGLTVSASLDGGKTWVRHKVLNDDGANYSDLVQAHDGTIGLLYGNGASAHDGFPVRFLRFNLEYLGF